MEYITRKEFYLALALVWLYMTIAFLTVVNPSPTIVPSWVNGVGLFLVILCSILLAIIYWVRFFRCRNEATRARTTV
jgi:hypothetical protein